MPASPEGTSSCPPPDDLSAYLDGTLQGTDRDNIEEHLARCEDCLDLAAGAREGDVEGAGDRAPIPFVPGRGAGWRRLAAAAAVIVAGAWFLRPAPLPTLDRGDGRGPVPMAAGPQTIEVPGSDYWIVSLPGDVRVAADPGTLLHLSPPYRAVGLARGSAQFEVTPGGGPFSVRAAEGNVRVLGTVFRVSVLDLTLPNPCGAAQAAAVEVERGTVLLENGRGAQRVREGQRGVLVAGRVPPVQDGDAARIWLTGFLDRDPVPDATAEILLNLLALCDEPGARARLAPWLREGAR